jgi:hypothetical protein
MAFTIDSPMRYNYVDTREGPRASDELEVEARAITRAVHQAVEHLSTAPEPAGYRITHVFQVANEDGEAEDLQYVESMDVETWEHITPAIDVLLTRTRAEGWTVSMTVAQLNLPRRELNDEGIQQSPVARSARS